MKNSFLRRSFYIFLSLSSYSVVTHAREIPPGESIYMQSCAICHGADGESMMPGVPDLAGNTAVLDQGDDLLISRIIKGFQSPGSPLAMPAKGGNPSLRERDVPAVLDYMRRSFR